MCHSLLILKPHKQNKNTCNTPQPVNTNKYEHIYNFVRNKNVGKLVKQTNTTVVYTIMER